MKSPRIGIGEGMRAWRCGRLVNGESDLRPSMQGRGCLVQPPEGFCPLGERAGGKRPSKLSDGGQRGHLLGFEQYSTLSSTFSGLNRLHPSDRMRTSLRGLHTPNVK